MEPNPHETLLTTVHAALVQKRPCVLWLDYSNHRGERTIRHVEVYEVFDGEPNEWHPHPGKRLRALDIPRRVERTFDLLGVHGWYPHPPSER